MRFNPKTGAFVDIFVAGDSENDLQRPDGLVFSPDGTKLYVASFRRALEPAGTGSDPSDNDKILIFSATDGSYLDKIDLAAPVADGGDRAFAQALLFGPDGRLYVPISGGGSDTGSVRAYDVATKTYEVFIPPGSFGDSGQPRYLTFGRTDPATLNYK